MRLIDADALVLDMVLKETIISGATDAILALGKAPTVDLWHYPSKGEYPTEGEEVFVAWTSEGSYDVVEFRYDRWGMKLLPPYAWQHIVSPKEEA